MPALSTATQKSADEHETPVTDGPPKPAELDSTRCGADHLAPSQWIASPVESTAAQKLAVGQETLVRSEVVPKT
jgi:hypothetical protein